MIIANNLIKDALVIGDLPTGGDIGNYYETIDVASAFKIYQTTPNQDITAPALPIGKDSTEVVLINAGNVPFKVYGVKVDVDNSITIHSHDLGWKVSAGGSTDNIPNSPESTLGRVAIGDMPVGGIISTAPLTTDINSTIEITQTTADQQMSLADPTNPTGTRLVTVINSINSTASFRMYNQELGVGVGAMFIWDGLAWHSASGVANVGAEFGEVIPANNATPAVGNSSSATAIDYFAFTLPSAGVWAIHTTLRGLSNVPAGGLAGALEGAIFTNANVLVADSEIMCHAYTNTATSAPHTANHSGSATHILKTNGVTTYKIRVWNNTNTGNTSAVGNNPNGQCKVTFVKISGYLPIANNDFFKAVIDNSLPDGVNDITEEIYHDGDVIIGGSTTTVKPVGASANNNYLTLSLVPGAITQLMRNTTPLEYYISRNTPNVVNGYADICKISGGAAVSRVLTFAVVVPSVGFSTTKYYTVATKWNHTLGLWNVLKPDKSSGIYSGNDFEILIMVDNQDLYLRFRRTAGATAGAFRVLLSDLADYQDTIEELSTTGNDVNVYPVLDTTEVGDWRITGNTGTVASIVSGNAAQINNFIGTRDNTNWIAITNADSPIDKSFFELQTTTSSLQGLTPTDTITRFGRSGANGQTFSQQVEFAVGRHTGAVSTTASTLFDIRLTNANVNVADVTPMRIFSSGAVAVGVDSINVTRNAGNFIGRNGVGSAMLHVAGLNGSNNNGAHIQATTDADNFPLWQMFNFTHNNVHSIYDGYWDGGWKHGHNTRPFSVTKAQGALMIVGSRATGNAGDVWVRDAGASFRYAGAGAVAGTGQLELAINTNLVYNRKIVLHDSTAITSVGGVSDHAFYGFGVAAAMVRYQTQIGASHAFFGAIDDNSSRELFKVDNLTRTTYVSTGTVLAPVQIANIAVNGVLGGNAPATVDIATLLVWNQATANIAVKLANPTALTAGRIIFVTMAGAAAGCTVNARPLTAGLTLGFIWDGNSWNRLTI